MDNIFIGLTKIDSNQLILLIRDAFIVAYIILSIFLCIRVYKDASKKYNDHISVILLVVFVFFTNILGYFIYNIIKPNESLQDRQMMKLEKFFLEYETRGIGRCRICKNIYFPEHTYCVSCGSIVRTKCNSCFNVIELDWNVCPYCGDKKKVSTNSLNPPKN